MAKVEQLRREEVGSLGLGGPVPDVQTGEVLLLPDMHVADMIFC